MAEAETRSRYAAVAVRRGGTHGGRTRRAGSGARPDSESRPKRRSKSSRQRRNRAGRDWVNFVNNPAAHAGAMPGRI